MTIMGESIQEKLKIGDDILPNFYHFNKESGSFKLRGEKSSNPHKILLMDWADISNELGNGYSEAAGDALFQALLHGEKKRDFSLKYVHFIGLRFVDL